jgi:hypothetical protein
MDTIKFLTNDKNKDGRTFNSVEEMFEDMDREFRQTNPIGYWIDHTLFKGNVFLGYAPHYSLTHPWKSAELGIDQIRYAWQRVFKGYDERVVWGIDYYLTENIPIWLKELKKNNIGVSMQYFDSNDWNEEKSDFNDDAMEKALIKQNEVLDKIIEGFEAQKRIEDEALWKNDPEYEELKNKFDEAFDLFHKYYGTFGD